MQLYSAPYSGNAYKARLLLALLGLDYECIDVDILQGTRAGTDLQRHNPRAQIPVLVDEDITVWDSQAILCYLARRYGADHWLPLEAGSMAGVMQWLAVSENELLFGLARARAVLRFQRPWDLAACQQLGRKGLDVLEGRLRDHDWLVTNTITIADIACYPYVALAPEGGVALDGYPEIRAWLAHISTLPGHVGMPGIETGRP